jgi:hypothetical protein
MTKTDEFDALEKKLEETLSRLKLTKDRKSRPALLREIRLLLMEADRLIQQSRG